jgi:competence protein ComEC
VAATDVLAPAPPWSICLLGLLGLAWGRGAAPVGLALAAGLLLGWSRWQVSMDWPRGLDLSAPVAATVCLDGHPQRRDDEMVVHATLSVLAQRQAIRLPGAEITLVLPATATAALGETLRVRGYLARSALPANPGVRQDPGAWRLRVKSLALIARVAPPGPVARLSGALRGRLATALDGRSRGLDLARALVIGDGSRLAPALERGLRRCGLSHVLSVSGLHLALLVAVVAAVSRPLGGQIRTVAVIAAVTAFVLAVGPLPALLRSAVMAMVALASLLARRPPWAAHGLALAAVALLTWQPSLVADLGFGLSMAATAGLVLFARPLASRWAGAAGGWRLPAVLGQPLAATVAAQLASLPLSLPVFALLCPLAPLFNLVLVPWTGVVQVAAFAWTGLALVTPGLAARLVPGLDLLAAPLAWTAQLPPANWWLWPLAVGAPTALVVALVLAVVCWWPRRLLPVVGVLWLGFAAWPRPAAEPQLVMLDVGQGDALLVRDGAAAALVDGGGWPSGDLGLRVLVPALAELGVRRLTLAVATHGDRDHCGGLLDLAGYLPVDQLLLGPDWRAGSCTRELAAVAGSPFGPRMAVGSAGGELAVGRWQLRVLSPAPDDPGPDNERSLVLLATLGRYRLLLTGDAGEPAEGRLRRRLGDSALDVDLLKVGHHGSPSATGPGFLAATSPRLALLSVGRRNAYGHPSPAVLDRLARAGVRLLRSDLVGQVRITFRSAGQGPWRVETPSSPPG